MTRPRARILWLIALLALVALSTWGWRAARPPQPSTAMAAAVPACSIPAIDSSARYPGMVWVPAGQFDMGDTKYPEEGPIRPTRVDGFWMDRTEVRNDEFAAFVQATGYVTVAERAWDAQRQPDLTPALRAPGAVVFAMPTKLHSRNDLQQWWQYVAGAQWRHPGGPSTDIQGRGQRGQRPRPTAWCQHLARGLSCAQLGRRRLCRSGPGGLLHPQCLGLVRHDGQCLGDDP
jgi:formylglycine-generating enzyme